MINISDKPQVLVKKKNIQPVIDYCIEQNIEFSVKHKPLPDDEWLIEVNIPSIKKAIVFGMFLRENRLSIIGLDPAPVTQKGKKVLVSKKEDTELDETEKPAKESKKGKGKRVAENDSNKLF